MANARARVGEGGISESSVRQARRTTRNRVTLAEHSTQFATCAAMIKASASLSAFAA